VAARRPRRVVGGLQLGGAAHPAGARAPRPGGRALQAPAVRLSRRTGARETWVVPDAGVLEAERAALHPPDPALYPGLPAPRGRAAADRGGRRGPDRSAGYRPG